MKLVDGEMRLKAATMFSRYEESYVIQLQNAHGKHIATFRMIQLKPRGLLTPKATSKAAIVQRNLETATYFMVERILMVSTSFQR